MRTASVAATALAALTPFVSAAVDISSIPRVTSAKVVDGAYIIELHDGGSLNGKRAFSVSQR